MTFFWQMSNLILNFPDGYQPREKQVKALKGIEKAFADGKKFVILHADTGCLTGDTEVLLNRGGNGMRYKLKDAYLHINGIPPFQIPEGTCKCGCLELLRSARTKILREHVGRDRIWSKMPKIRSLVNNELRLQEMINVVYSGKKQVYELKLENDFKLKGTACHPILTTIGFIPLGELTPSHDILIDPIWDKNKYQPLKKEEIKIRDKFVLNLWHHPYARKVAIKHNTRGFTMRVPEHILKYEAGLNNLPYDELINRCRIGKNLDGLNFVDSSIYAIHHKDHNHHNNEYSNLECMTHSDHMTYHGNLNYINFWTFAPKISKMLSVTKLGIEDTYDIQCPSPYHNFVANGIVVHNSGKSHISKTLGNISRQPSKEFIRKVEDYSIYGEDGPAFMADEPAFGCFALTITKSLQDQYFNTFENTGILKGQSNYQCDVDNELTVDVAPCIYMKTMKNDCCKANRCPYYNHRNNMLISQFSTLNYSMFFSLPPHLQKREILVCDEGSELADQLVSQFTCEVDIPFLMKTNTLVSAFPTQETVPKVLSWLMNLLINVEKSVESYKEWFKDSSHQKDKILFNKKKNEYSRLSNFFGSLKTLIDTYYDSQYIIEHVDNTIRFIPLKVDVLSKYLFSQADKVVILSATIIDPASFCKELGIPEYAYVRVDTDFLPSKSPIHIMAKQKLNYANLKGMLPTLMKQIKGILDHHSDEKGIIHTHTQFLADYIRDNIKSNRLLCREAGVRNEELLELHEASPRPTVLVSPSMTYGVDLKGDLGKFQIILKAPWLPTKDVRVEKLMKIDKEWYANAMLKTLVQACGRSVRSEDDECETYILDGSIYDAMARNKHKLPKFFIERFN